MSSSIRSIIRSSVSFVCWTLSSYASYGEYTRHSDLSRPLSVLLVQIGEHIPVIYTFNGIHVTTRILDHSQVFHDLLFARLRQQQGILAIHQINMRYNHHIFVACPEVRAIDSTRVTYVILHITQNTGSDHLVDEGI